LREFLCALAEEEGKGILLSTHAIVEVESLAHRVVILDHGEVIVDGPVDALVHSNHTRAVVELDLPESSTADTLVEALTQRFGSVTRIDSRVLLRADDTLDSVETVLQCIRGHGVVPRRLGVRRPSLEDVFVELTGRRYEP
jgi:ABC-2 type transport system ATP-binding protein